MRLAQYRIAQGWLIGVSLGISLICLMLTVQLERSTMAATTQTAAHGMATRADALARQIEADLAEFDLALREVGLQARNRDDIQGQSKAWPFNLPVMARYLGFINVLNEAGDVIADPKSNAPRPANFAGRDYFQNQLKNSADILMIGRPFATASMQRASIPLSRRLVRPDGGFDGVVVAGVHLTWLSDLLSLPSAGPRVSVTIRRDDGVILMRAPADVDAIGRGGESDPAWRNWLSDGVSSVTGPSGDMALFRRLGGPLVLELTLARADIVPEESRWLPFAPLLVCIPGLCVLALGFLVRGLWRHQSRIEQAARAANEERMRLLATMSHELRTPLTGILGEADLMADADRLNESQRRRLARMTEAATLMRVIVDRVTDLTQPDDRAETPVPIPCDLDALARASLAVVEAEAKRKGLDLRADVDLATPRYVMLARDFAQQVLINLLMNAVKFTPEGTVALRVSGDAAKVRFEVADTGPGIPPDKRRRLFHPYDRLDRAAGGTGLGLSITERFVGKMGGRIGHGENPGGGSLFWVELPAVKADTPPHRPRDAAAPASDVRPLRLLLADDLDLTRSVTAEYLRASGHRVTEVPDGEAALAALNKQNFDVVLTDMRMPVVDGLEVARRIRALPGERRHTPIILITADLAAITRADEAGNGVDICLRKPFTRAELLAAVAAGAARERPSAADPADCLVPDASALSDLRCALGDTAFAAQLDAAMSRIAALITRLKRPDAADDAALRAAAHDLVGVAGLFGFAALAARLRDFGIEPVGQAPLLRKTAAASLEMLRERRARDIGAAPGNTT